MFWTGATPCTLCPNGAWACIFRAGTNVADRLGHPFAFGYAACFRFGARSGPFGYLCATSLLPLCYLLPPLRVLSASLGLRMRSFGAQPGAFSQSDFPMYLHVSEQQIDARGRGKGQERSFRRVVAASSRWRHAGVTLASHWWPRRGNFVFPGRAFRKGRAPTIRVKGRHVRGRDTPWVAQAS